MSSSKKNTHPAKKQAAKSAKQAKTKKAAPTMEPMVPEITTEPLAEAATPEPAAVPTAPTAPTPSTMSGIDAAAKVLAEAGEPLKCRAIVARAFEKGYWRSGGKTPAATINAAMIREIAKKGEAARFAKTGRGLFAIRA